MRISVIVPVYNAGKTLEACVRSAAEQEGPETEILLIDDGSTDGTVPLAEKLGETYSFVRLLRQEHGGASRARNLGLEEAGGECVLFLDADDLLMPGALKALAEGITEESDGCCGRILRGTEKESGGSAVTGVTGLLRGEDLMNAALARPTELLPGGDADPAGGMPVYHCPGEHDPRMERGADGELSEDRRKGAADGGGADAELAAVCADDAAADPDPRHLSPGEPGGAEGTIRRGAAAAGAADDGRGLPGGGPGPDGKAAAAGADVAEGRANLAGVGGGAEPAKAERAAGLRKNRRRGCRELIL